MDLNQIANNLINGKAPDAASAVDKAKKLLGSS